MKLVHSELVHYKEKTKRFISSVSTLKYRNINHFIFSFSTIEVIDSGILDTISTEDKKLYESLYEVVTSETSYNKSLNVLLKYFAQSPKLSGIGSNR